MRTNLKIDELKELLPKREPFSKEELRGFFSKKGIDLSNENLDVRINRLKAKGIIVNVGRGWYRTNDKKIFEPGLTPTLKKISSLLKKEFPYLNYALWSTNWLNELTTLQLFRNIYIIEVEAGSEDAVFRTIKESFPHTTFLDPKETEWENYKTERSENIIIKTMISESPKVKYRTMSITKLEKIMVDLYCDKLLRTIFSGELANIYMEVCKNYVLNFTTLLSYAGRRGKKTEIWEYIKSLDILEEPTIQMIEI
ncbi:MAG: hypothetical protein Q7W45_08760 [Bacteroidota bacterium]|nr:hypothetical protein [Bacteroidota bacterium]MDP3144232.1 hypothetical protein [Bacteroidota bacterium]